ncbi:MAG: hypothetical protein D6730_21355 [Bacteroidetes bacterium]|nr:MAG: hypothetical protein D6730_21355 [Bacteroidota bacterium]
MVHTSRNFYLLLAGILLAAGLSVSGCKSKKVITEAPPPPVQTDMEDTRLTQAKAALEELLNSPQSRDFPELEGKERKLADIQNLQLDDGEVLVLIKKVEYKLEQERAFLEAEKKRMEEQRVYSQLAESFDAIARAPNVNVANSRINETLEMFSSENALVLVVISQEGGNKDFDRPTTIKDYLHYLKDQKQNKNSIGNIVFDRNGKIKELELVKNF